MRLALYQPDIPQNAAALMRLTACLDVALDIIEPCGFILSDKRLQRTGMDYLDHVDLTRHVSFEAFCDKKAQAPDKGRLILLTTKATTAYTDFSFQGEDTLLLGRESAGVPADVIQATDAQLTIPMKEGLRSLNVAMAGALVLGEALRQTRQFPDLLPQG